MGSIVVFGVQEVQEKKEVLKMNDELGIKVNYLEQCTRFKQQFNKMQEKQILNIYVINIP